MLVECMAPEARAGLADAAAILAELPAGGPPVLLHAEGPAVWDVLAEAIRRRLSTRIGLEDVRTLPDGSPASGNADLVTAAVLMGATAADW